MTTWREAITAEMKSRDETWAAVLACTLSDEELDEQFNDGYGTPYGKPFTLWTIDRVYFPAVYDGSEWVESVPRWPNDEPTNHVGGG